MKIYEIYETSSFVYNPQFTIIDDSEYPYRIFKIDIKIEGAGYDEKEKKEKLKEAFLKFQEKHINLL